MRFAIYHGNKDLVPLEKELDYLTDYVELQRLRLNPVRHELKFHVEGDPVDLLLVVFDEGFKRGLVARLDRLDEAPLFSELLGRALAALLLGIRNPSRLLNDLLFRLALGLRLHGSASLSQRPESAANRPFNKGLVADRRQPTEGKQGAGQWPEVPDFCSK